MGVTCSYYKKIRQFKMVCKYDSGCITRLKQQKSERWYYIAVPRHIVNQQQELWDLL